MNTAENIHQQLAVARTEIKNLRQQISALKFEHQTEINHVQQVLDELRCASCGEIALSVVTKPKPKLNQVTNNLNEGCIPFRPIGVLRTSFNMKRGVPRQAPILANSKGTVEIYTSVFNNPEHATYGLHEFSHMWILYHFHAIESTGTPAKVSPPRLCGKKLGVFSTRAPLRPCPIGLSLVRITKIEGNKIHFLGVDMVNGTPVLDVKPYIPHYDDPAYIPDITERPRTEGTAEDAAESIDKLDIDDGESISSAVTVAIDDVEASPPRSPDVQKPLGSRSSADLLAFGNDNQRGAPDGQEHLPTKPVSKPDKANVKIASWIINPPSQVFEVNFTSEAFDRLTELIGDRAETFKSNIQSLLSEDPRSHYVKTRYPDHEFSCVLEDLSITCIFDAGTAICTIIAVKNAEEMEHT